MDATFRHIVCAVDGTESATEGVRQAERLAATGALIELLHVSDQGGDYAHHVVEDAVRQITRTDVAVKSRIVSGHPVWKVLLDESDNADLLVIGRHGTFRGAGIALHSTASSVIHHGRHTLLVASELEAGDSFPGRILVAADGPGDPEEAVLAAGAIARNAGHTDITLLRLDWGHRPKRPTLADAVDQIRDITGDKPDEIVIGGTPHRLIPEYAAREGASLVVMGTRGLSGVRALRSVSERVAHTAPCSVLIVHSNGNGNGNGTAA